MKAKLSQFFEILKKQDFANFASHDLLIGVILIQNNGLCLELMITPKGMLMYLRKDLVLQSR